MFKTDREVWTLVERLEQCRLAPEEFGHRNHLAAGMAYLHVSGSVDEALARLRGTLLRYIAHLGKTGYHETLTRFWLLRLEELRLEHAGKPLHRLCEIAADDLRDKDLVYAYYDRERLMSDEAKAGWVEPSRHPIVVRARTGRM